MSAEVDVLKREREWLVALERHDFKTLERVLADDFTLTPWASAGETITKREYLEDAKLVHISEADVRGCATQIYGDTAIVKCRLRWVANYGGMTFSADLLITDVWLKFDDGWKAVSRHVSTLGDPAVAAALTPEHAPSHPFS